MDFQQKLEDIIVHYGVDCIENSREHGAHPKHLERALEAISHLIDTELEYFVPIRDYPHYLIGSHGTVKSIERKTRSRWGKMKTTPGKTLKQSLRSHLGYIGYHISNSEGRKTVSAHRLVAEHFIPNPEGKPCVNHLDHSTTNNRVDNLEWCTHKENTAWAVTAKRFPVQQHTHCPNGHEFTEENTRLTKEGHRSCRTCMKIHNQNRYLDENNKIPLQRLRLKGGSDENIKA